MSPVKSEVQQVLAHEGAELFELTGPDLPPDDEEDSDLVRPKVPDSQDAKDE